MKVEDLDLADGMDVSRYKRSCLVESKTLFASALDRRQLIGKFTQRSRVLRAEGERTGNPQKSWAQAKCYDWVACLLKDPSTTVIEIRQRVLLTSDAAERRGTLKDQWWSEAYQEILKDLK